VRADDLGGQVAIITGGAQGIGRSCAEALAASGATIFVADIDADKASATASEIRDHSGGDAYAYRVDITEPSQCEGVVAEATDVGGRLSILVNCAIMYREAEALDQDPAEWADVVNVGLNGAFYMSQAFARAVTTTAHRGGCVVNMSSVSGTHSMYRKAAYSAAKAALDSMTRSLALEWGPLDIRINAVAPSHAATETIKALAANGLLPIDKIAGRIPLGRLVEPSEIADAVLFLCSDRARFITGQVIAVDGGYTANGDC
jgi:NAD(P)-dependent dehydrogenase (short-subunit alcohol dehydrogenase family)